MTAVATMMIMLAFALVSEVGGGKERPNAVQQRRLLSLHSPKSFM